MIRIRIDKGEFSWLGLIFEPKTKSYQSYDIWFQKVLDTSKGFEAIVPSGEKKALSCSCLL